MDNREGMDPEADEEDFDLAGGREWIESALTQVRRYMRRRPVEGALIALLTGGLLSLLLKRSR